MRTVPLAFEHEGQAYSLRASEKIPSGIDAFDFCLVMPKAEGEMTESRVEFKGFPTRHFTNETDPEGPDRRIVLIRPMELVTFRWGRWT